MAERLEPEVINRPRRKLAVVRIDPGEQMVLPAGARVLNSWVQDRGQTYQPRIVVLIEVDEDDEVREP